ncbi:hypothetical protein JOJ87_000398 [Rhodococcus ruber]|nr:hypothetical protein [Rhodococcus ruber]
MVSSIEAIATRICGFIRAVTENQAPARCAATTNA